MSTTFITEIDLPEILVETIEQELELPEGFVFAPSNIEITFTFNSDETGEYVEIEETKYTFPVEVDVEMQGKILKLFNDSKELDAKIEAMCFEYVEDEMQSAAEDKAEYEAYYKRGSLDDFI